MIPLMPCIYASTTKGYLLVITCLFFTNFMFHKTIPLSFAGLLLLLIPLYFYFYWKRYRYEITPTHFVVVSGFFFQKHTILYSSQLQMVRKTSDLVSNLFELSHITLYSNTGTLKLYYVSSAQGKQIIESIEQCQT